MPLRLPAGRAAFGPQLQLEYQSSSGNGPFGVGWRLGGLLSIVVDTTRGLPRYDSSDRYAFSVAGELVAVAASDARDADDAWEDAGEYAVWRFRARFERGHHRIEQWIRKITRAVHWITRDARGAVTYTALADSGLRNTVESTLRNVGGSLVQTLRTTPLPRAVSLRQEFSSTFQRAMTSAPSTEVTFDIDERFLPILLRGRSFDVSRALLLLRTARGATGAGFAVTLGGADIDTFVPSADFPGHREANALPGLAGGLVARHVFTIENAADLAPSSAPVVPAAADPTKLADLILYVELTMRTDP